MAGIRVRANAPLDANPAMAGALVPVPVESVWAWRSRGAIHGAPGTEAVPAPAPFPGTDRELIANETTGYIGLPSSVVPQRWYPPLYYQTDWPEHFPGQYLNSSHELPIPSIQAPEYIASRGVNTPGGINQFSPGSFLARLGGQSPIPQPTSIGNVNYA